MKRENSEYLAAREKERKRIDFWKNHTKRGWFWTNRVLSHDFATNLTDDEERESFLSDNWLGVERMLDAIDRTDHGARCNDTGEILHLSLYSRLKEKARDRVRKNAAMKHTLPTFDLILKNGKNREESIWAMKQILLAKASSGSRKRKKKTSSGMRQVSSISEIEKNC